MIWYIDTDKNVVSWLYSRTVLGMGSSNETGGYIVTSPLIGRAHTQNDPDYVTN